MSFLYLIPSEMSIAPLSEDSFDIYLLYVFLYSVNTMCLHFFSVKLVVFVYSSKLNKTLLGMSHLFFCCGSLTPVSHLH